MKNFWKFMWSEYPMIMGALAKYINLDEYPDRFYMGDTLIFASTEYAVDEDLTMHIIGKFFSEYFDTLIYTVPKDTIEEDDQYTTVLAMGVYFPKSMLEIIENHNASYKSKIKRFWKKGSDNLPSARMEFMEMIMELTNRYFKLMLQDNNIMPPSPKLADYILAIIPTEKAADEVDELIN